MGCENSKGNIQMTEQQQDLQDQYYGEHVTTQDNEDQNSGIKNIKSIITPQLKKKNSIIEKNNNIILENLIQFKSKNQQQNKYPDYKSYDNNYISESKPVTNREEHFNEYYLAPTHLQDQQLQQLIQQQQQQKNVNQQQLQIQSQAHSQHNKTSNTQNKKQNEYEQSTEPSQQIIESMGSVCYFSAQEQQLSQSRNLNNITSMVNNKQQMLAKQKAKINTIDENQQEFQFRIGKSLLECKQESQILIEVIVKKLLPEMSKCQSILAQNFTKQIQHLLEKWVNQVYMVVASDTGEIKNFLSIKNTNNYFRLQHEINGWESCEILEKFCCENQLQMDQSYLKEMKKQMIKIKALTTTVWIEFFIDEETKQLQINVGFAGDQPFDEKILSSMIKNEQEKNNILSWQKSTQPIVTNFGFVINSEHVDQIFNFYMFENDETGNLQKSLLAFQNYGASFDQKFMALLKSVNASDYNITFHLNCFGLLNLKLKIPKLKKTQELEFLNLVKTDKFQKYAWDQITQKIFGHAQNNFHFLEFNPDGLFFYKITEIGLDIGSFCYSQV